MHSIVARWTAFAAAAVLTTATAIAGQAAKTDLTGKWTFNVETAAGSGQPTITLKQDGSFTDARFELTGNVKGAEFTFKFNVDAQGNNLECTYKGTVDAKDAAKGTVNIAGLADGTFTAKKQ